MAFAVADDMSPLGAGDAVGVVVATGDDHVASFNVVWIKEHDGGQQVPAQLTVSIEGVRGVYMDNNGQTNTILFSDYYHIKSWDVATQKFGLKLMEQPQQGGGSVELNFHFLTQEARMIAGAVKAQVDQLILEKQNGIGEAIVHWALHKKLFRKKSLSVSPHTLSHTINQLINPSNDPSRSNIRHTPRASRTRN